MFTIKVGLMKGKAMKFKRNTVTKKVKKSLSLIIVVLIAMIFSMFTNIDSAYAQTGFTTTTTYNDLPVNHVRIVSLPLCNIKCRCKNIDIFLLLNAYYCFIFHAKIFTTSIIMTTPIKSRSAAMPAM